MSDLGSETTMLRVVQGTMNRGKHMKNKVWEETSSRSQNDTVWFTVETEVWTICGVVKSCVTRRLRLRPTYQDKTVENESMDMYLSFEN